MIVKIAVGGVIGLPGRVGLEDPYILEMAKEKGTRRSAVSAGGPMKSTSGRAKKKNFSQAKEEDISVHFESEKKCFARMKAPDDQEDVWCGLGMCQCSTFKADHLPCKHIYKLALIRGMIE